jgi:hypothetical protein
VASSIAELEKTYQAAFEELSSTEKEQVMEVQIIWKEEGRREGRQEGWQEAMSAMIWRLLERRLGSIGPDIREQINALDADQLGRLEVDLWEFADLNDLSQ